MPTYRYPLANGKSLVLEGDQKPSDADVETAARQAGVLSLLQANTKPREETPLPGPLGTSAGLAGKAIIEGGRFVVPRIPGGLPSVAAGSAGATLGGKAGALVGSPFGGASIGGFLGHRLGQKIGAPGEGALAGTLAGHALASARQRPPVEQLVIPASEAAPEAQRIRLLERAAKLRGLQSAAGEPISKVPSLGSIRTATVKAGPRMLHTLGTRLSRLGTAGTVAGAVADLWNVDEALRQRLLARGQLPLVSQEGYPIPVD